MLPLSILCQLISMQLCLLLTRWEVLCVPLAVQHTGRLCRWLECTNNGFYWHHHNTLMGLLILQLCSKVLSCFHPKPGTTPQAQILPPSTHNWITFSGKFYPFNKLVWCITEKFVWLTPPLQIPSAQILNIFVFQVMMSSSMNLSTEKSR